MNEEIPDSMCCFHACNGRHLRKRAGFYRQELGICDRRRGFVFAAAEQLGAIFKENGVAKPGLEILPEHSYNWNRLRIFVAPTKLPNNLDYTLAAAKQAKAMGFKFLLDFY